MNFIEKNKAIMKIADTFGPKNQRLNSLYGLGIMLEEDDIDEDEFIEEIEDVLSDML